MLSTTKITAIHSSPLQRALLTAQAVQSAQPVSVPLETSPLLKEENFGQGEGKRYDGKRQPHLSFEEHIARGIFIPPTDRNDRFPDGESRNDVAKRAQIVVSDIILPYVRTAVEGGIQDLNVVFVSHGIFISELIAALLRQGGEEPRSGQFRGMKNTAWTLLTVKANAASDRKDGQIFEVQVIEHNSYRHLDTLVSTSHTGQSESEL
ncbi:hypothetical protein H0H93_012765 [Arthromyces matolae]|nr:hypothetical protein H0H93_012765 [Arthromyces matolae]